MNDRILFIDTETGGTNPLKHSLLSIGLVVWENYEIISSKEILVADEKLNVTTEALSINKINIENHYEESYPPNKVINELSSFLTAHFDNEKITLAGHNINFDINFIRFFLERYNYNFYDFFSHRSIDTSSILYYLYLAGKLKQKKISSSDAFKLFGIKVKERHTALGDAIATAELFTKLILLVKKKLNVKIDKKMLSQKDLFEN